MAVLKPQERWEYAEKYRRVFKIQNDIGFGDMNIIPPDIDFFNDGECYTNHKMIHIGVGKGTFDLFECDSEESFYNAAEYVRGHEEQHCRSTAQDPYANGIRIGMEAIIDYVALQVEKKPKRFPSWKHYEQYVNNELPKKGVYLSMDTLSGYVQWQQNSLEDGRIERLRSNKFPGFEKLRCYYRAKFWTNSKNSYEHEPYEKIKNDPMKRFGVLTSCLFMLATCQLFPQNFIDMYGDTPLKGEVDTLMPHIAKAVMAGRTRTMAAENVELCKILAPYIYNMCRLSAEDVEKRRQMEKMMADFLKAIVDRLPDGNLSEQNEDTDDGSANSALPYSDLVITLDDETYDKLMEKSQKGGNGSGMMVRREHPKEEANSESEANNGTQGGNGSQSQKDAADAMSNGGQSGSSSGDDNSQDGQPQDSSNGGAVDNGQSDKQDDNASEGSGANGSSSLETQDSQQEGNASSGSEKEGKSSSKSQDGKQAGDASDDSPESGKNGKTDSQSRTNSCSMKPAGKDSGESSSGGVNPDATKSEQNAAVDEIEKAMEEAASSLRAEAKDAINSVNQAQTFEKRRAAARKKETGSVPKDDPVTAESVKDICPFTELRRKYKVTEKEPVDVAKRGRTLNRKNRMYFKSLSTPNVSFLDEGAIDPGRLYGLAMKETDVFRRKGNDRVFDGCAYILIDNSGSMRGAKRAAACRAAAIIEDGFDGIMPIKIVAFDSSCGVVIHEVVKDWNERLSQNGCWNFYKQGRYGHGNEDGHDIRIATRELSKRTERKKLLCVLSDGAPGSTDLCKMAVNEARKAGITVCGIYFEEGRIGYDAETFKNMYQRDYICCTDQEIDGNLTKIFRKFATSK